MPRIRTPRSGSMQYWPRKRAKRQYSRIRQWPSSNEPKLLGFAGYKVGMTHTLITNNRKASTTKNEDIVCPITIVECPPLKAVSIRFFKKSNHGLKILTEIFHDKPDKELGRKVALPKKIKGKEPTDFDKIRILVHTQPKLTSIGKVKPEIFEIGVGGKKEDQLKYAKEILGKEINVTDIIKPGQQLDVVGVSKGKGFQGAIKRFGIGLKSHKSEKGVRNVGTLGGWKSQGHFMYRVAHAGQMGYHQRKELNKWVIKIEDKLETLNPKGGFNHYGLIKNPCLLIKGSLIGPQKRLLTFTQPSRKSSIIPKDAPSMIYINTKK